MSLFQQIELQKSSLSGSKLQALEQFLSKGFPTKKDEEYKYTHLKEIVEKDYNFSASEHHSISKKQLDELHLGEEHFDFIVFVNGKLHKELSNISVENAEFLTLNYALSHESYSEIIKNHFNTIANQDLAFCNLNEALHENGFFLHVPKNVVIEKPIHVFYLSQNQDENTFYNTRNLLIVEEGAKISVTELVNT